MKTSDEIIDALGGTSEVAKICEITMPSVSDWRKDGIPKARLMYLKAIRPDIFETDPAVSTAQATPHRTEQVAV
jgi:hypothetical protein